MTHHSVSLPLRNGLPPSSRSRHCGPETKCGRSENTHRTVPATRMGYASATSNHRATHRSRNAAVVNSRACCRVSTGRDDLSTGTIARRAAGWAHNAMFRCDEMRDSRVQASHCLTARESRHGPCPDGPPHSQTVSLISSLGDAPQSSLVRSGAGITGVSATRCARRAPL